MINVSNDFKEAMKERRDFTSYAEITFRNGEKLTLDSSKFTTSNNSITDGAGVSSFPLGLAIQKNLKIEILNDEEQYRDYDFVGAKIRSYLDFKLDDGRTERIEKGTYTVVTPETYGETIIITAYDDMYKADKDYTTKLTFPQTAGSVLRDVCSTCDINLGSTSFLHDNFIIQEQPTGKFRDVIGYVAMIACGNARVDTRNQLQIISYDLDWGYAINVGRNLFIETAYAKDTFTQGSKETIGWYKSNVRNYVTEVDGFKCIKVPLESWDVGQYVEVESGKVYTCSCDVRLDDSASIDSSSFYLLPDVLRVETNLFSDKITKTWQRIVITWTSNVTGIERIHLRGLLGQKDYFLIKNIKFEKGNKSTDWTPAPEDGGNPYYILSEWQSPKIEYNDNVITGFKTVIKGDTSENDTEVIVGTDAYMITVENPLITGKEETVLTWLFEKLANIPFRTFSGDLVSNPLIEFMDLVQVQDRRGNLYNSFITDVNFLLPGFTTVKNASPSMERYATSYSSSVAKTEVNLRKLVENERTDRELAVERLNKTLAESSGMYSTEEIQPNGSTIYYLHDKPTISESKNVMKLTAEAIGFSVDGGKTYPFGFTIDGELIMRIIQTEGLNADWINAGAFTIRDDSGNIIFTADKDTKQVLISGDSVRIGGKSAPDALNDVLKESKDYSDGKLSDYANVVSISVSNLQAQIDGQIETFYYDYEPALNNIPASNWKTEQDREKHEGDLFYWKSKGYAYRFFKDGSTWKWQIVQDTDITQAMATAQNAQDTADGKRRVFVNTPQAPYDVGDLWTNGTDILTCAVARTQGSAYVSSDWKKLNKYTDDSFAQQVQQNLDNLQIGGRNLALQSRDFTSGNEYWEINSLFTRSIDENGFTIMSASRSGATTNIWNRLAPHKYIPVEDMGKGITVSFDFMCDSVADLDHGCICSLQIYNSAGTRIGWYETPNILTLKQISLDNPLTDGVWTRAVVKFTESNLKTISTTENTVNDVSYTKVSFNLVKNGSVHFRKIKIEYGNAVTDWTPAPEDTETYADNLAADLQTQIDGKIQTYNQTADPSASWTTTAIKNLHTGDLWYNPNTKETKRWSGTAWTKLENKEAEEASALAQKKAQVFTGTPTVPYYVGDLWFNSATSDIMTCVKERTSGSYTASDWDKRNKYTDDTKANEALEEAKKSRNLNIILDNEYQGIPADYQGNIATFPTVKTFVQVLYGHTDVSVNCSYSIQKSSGVTGTWDNTTRTYTVTALTTDNGWVDITASYLSLFTTTKRFNVAKVKGGTPGEDGENGRGIKSTAVTYQASTSGTTVPTGTWQTSPPSVAANQYLWTRTIITYTDNTNSTSYSIGKMGANGTNGTDGKDGVGIGSVAEHYAVSTSNSTAPTSWSNSVPTMTATNKYLWNYETITYTNGTTSDTAKRVIGVYGDKGATGATGATGKGIKSVANYYLATASASGVTASTSGWTTTVQSVSASKKYLWNYEVVTFTDNTTSVTAPCVIGAYGDKGANGTNGTDGKDGVGVKTTAITYQASSSGTTIPNGTWSNSVPSTSAGQYLWTRTVITYTDNTTSTSYSVGRNGSNGTAARTYFIESSTLVLKRSADNSISPNFVEFKSFYRDGNNTSRIEYAGRFKIEETVDGITWTTLYTSSENESNITHSVYSVLSTANKEAIVTANGNMIGIPRDIIMIRCTLYASGGTTTALDMQSVTIVKDVDALTHEEIFNLLTNNGESKGIYKEGNQLYINATYLATGILTDLKKKNYWNLETGEFSLSSDVKNSVLDSQTQEQIYMKLTKNETLKGIFMQNGQLFVSFDYAKGGTLKLGGAGNINGLLSILNSSGTQIGKWDNSGVSINGGKIAIATNGKYGIMDSGGIRIATAQSGGDNLAQLTYSSSKLGGFLQLKSDGWGDTSIAGGYAVFHDVVTSNLTASGSKYRLVETESYGKRLLNAYETPTPFFGDIGQGITNENGECIVFIDDVFLETINTKIEYQVFLQKEGQGDLWIDKKEYNYFLVKGTENLKFAWEIKAIQKGYESERLDEFDNNKEIGLEFDYEQEYINEIDNFIAEQEASYYEAIK